MGARRNENLDRIAQPDIEMGATVRAKRLRFHGKPETEVRFDGQPDIDCVSGSERENLPETVEPGVTYRDIRVRWRAAAKLDSKQGDGDG
jgi:hypothetical protein